MVVLMNNYLSINDKLKIGKELLEFKIPYREEIKFPKEFTFGCEIEFSNAKFRQVNDEIFENKLHKWYMTKDETVYEKDKLGGSFGKGGEVTSPILTSNNDFKYLKKICDIIKFCNGEVNINTAGHIHIGSQIFEDQKHLNNFIFLWSTFEDVIERFLSGEFVKNEHLNILAKSCRKEFIEQKYNIEKILELRKKYNRHPKTYAVSFYNFSSFQYQEDNTIEFRKISGSLETEIWQNNCYCLSKLIEFSKHISKEDITYIKNNILFSEENNISFDKAHFLANLIFDNEFDRLCFLKQYFKDFYQDNNEIKKVKLLK